jgi:hypothetical protein
MACTRVHIHDTAIDFLMHEEARPYTVWFTYGYAIYGANNLLSDKCVTLSNIT